MGQAAVDKLERLLKRVQERAAAPRLRAVERPVSVEVARPPTLSSVPPEPETLPPVAKSPALGSAPTLESLAPAAGPSRKSVSITPLEAAMEHLPEQSEFEEGSGPLEVAPLAEPITMEKRAAASAQGLAPTQRHAAEDEELDQPIELIQPAARAKGPREATIAFETSAPAQRELRPVSDAPAPSAPSQVIEPTPPPAEAMPARVVSAARIDSPKTFGELLDLSLSLRPR